MTKKETPPKIAGGNANNIHTERCMNGFVKIFINGYLHLYINPLIVEHLHSYQDFENDVPYRIEVIQLMGQENPYVISLGYKDKDTWTTVLVTIDALLV